MKFIETLKILGIEKKIKRLEDRIKELGNLKYYTEAFIVYYSTAEYCIKKLTQRYKAFKEAEELTKSIIDKNFEKECFSKVSKKAREGLIKQTNGKIIAKLYKIYEDKRKNYLNIIDCIEVLKELKPNLEEEKINRIFKSEGDSCRLKRNNIVHNAEELTEKDFNSYKENFDYFFTILKDVYEKQLKTK